MRIYAITKGRYSDYHICALTADKEKAKRLKKIYSDTYDEACIEVFEDGDGSELRLLWRCDENGNNPLLIEYPEKEEVAVDKYGRIYAVYLYAKDKAHAEKKAHDMIAEYKAKRANI